MIPPEGGGGFLGGSSLGWGWGPGGHCLQPPVIRATFLVADVILK